MNCPVHTDPLPDEGHNQNPPAFAAELTTNNSLNHRANETEAKNASRIDLIDGSHGAIDPPGEQVQPSGGHEPSIVDKEQIRVAEDVPTLNSRSSKDTVPRPTFMPAASAIGRKVKSAAVKYAKFVGPGIMISIAYIDPGNYATDVAAGASYQYRLLFMVFASNLVAIFMQSLCIKLGTVTGRNLAENCRDHLPSWLNYALYAFAEAAIIATDVAEVIGTVIALNLLLHVPLIAGCIIALADVLLVLLFYNPSGMTLKATRMFEVFVALLVLGVVICFCFELSTIHAANIRSVFKGYLPSSALVQSTGLYQSCGILGATVMPHSLFLGSDLVKARLRDHDARQPPSSSSTQVLVPDSPSDNTSTAREGSSSSPSLEELARSYRPSLSAIRSCLPISIWELAISLFTFALFVNSAILIVAGSALYSLSPSDHASNADLFTIHALLSTTLAPAAATIFALALLLSGTSAGLVCTMAGQIVSEGQIRWRVRPWVRRLVTRGIAIVPSIVIAAAVGREGLSAALEASQVALSIVLPIASAPLIWFCARADVMKVDIGARDAENEGEGTSAVVMKNSWWTTALAVAVWLLITTMNVAVIVLLGMGKS